jgi:hypothetical protein
MRPGLVECDTQDAVLLTVRVFVDLDTVCLSIKRVHRVMKNKSSTFLKECIQRCRQGVLHPP